VQDGKEGGSIFKNEIARTSQAGKQQATAKNQAYSRGGGVGVALAQRKSGRDEGTEGEARREGRL